jgi:transcription elongation factor Elf1
MGAKPNRRSTMTARESYVRLTPLGASFLTEPKMNRCHYCGKLNWKIVMDETSRAMQVECATCGARGPRTFPIRAAAMTAWNTPYPFK